MLSVEVGGKLSYLYPLWLLGIHYWFLCQRFCSMGSLDQTLRPEVPVTGIMIAITNRKTRICHNRRVNLLFKRFLTLCFLVSESVAAGKSSCISNCIISVHMAPSNEALDSVSHKMLLLQLPSYDHTFYPIFER